MKRPVEGHAERLNAQSATGSARPLGISVLGRFELVDGRGAAIAVANGTQRLLSLLALRDRVVHRASVAGVLWPDVSESHAHASLRSALLRIPGAARSVVSVSDAELSLADGVDVDVRDAQALAQRLLDDTAPASEDDVSRVALAQLSSDLLPGWDDEWVTPEAEGWRQLRLHALEALTDRLAERARFGDATTAAMAAIRAEPLRESAHAALIRVHLAESNQSEALRQFERYQDLLRSELGIEPTSRLRELVGI
ncbi:MAG: family transcriptional regulator, regulator of embCAB operon [Actinomycetota bacterium]|jgi:DNA-binding SARP family transcriptional activator|nr:family transcriptional regulator, regulator of embCAB operon [Actinomycetota bacterium]